MDRPRWAPASSCLGIYRGLVPAEALPSGARKRMVRLWLGPGGHFVAHPVASGTYLSHAATVPLPSDAPPRESCFRLDPSGNASKHSIPGTLPSAREGQANERNLNPRMG